MLDLGPRLPVIVGSGASRRDVREQTEESWRNITDWYWPAQGWTMKTTSVEKNGENWPSQPAFM
jgi:hypothetical protein